jgi:ligand-binding SRPBCC domain-containing protein
MRFSYHSEQWLPYPPKLVFAFFANPENLPRLMPDWQHARIDKASVVPAPAPPANSPRYTSCAAGAGTRLTLSFRPFPYSPVRVLWKAEITEFVWNKRFRDRQLKGPFAYWDHCHTVEAQSRPKQTEPAARADANCSSDGTLLRDQVEYEMPLGILGRLAQRLFVERQLRATFEFRHQRTSDILARLAAASLLRS